MYRLLILEDEPFHRKNLKDLVEPAGMFEVSACKSAAEALALCEANRFDVIFADIVMPGMSGLECLRELSKRGFDGLSVIISAYADFEYARNAIELGVSAYLLKPFTKKSLQSLLDKLVEQLRSREQHGVRSAKHDEELRTWLMEDGALPPDFVTRSFSECAAFQVLAVRPLKNALSGMDEWDALPSGQFTSRAVWLPEQNALAVIVGFPPGQDWRVDLERICKVQEACGGISAPFKDILSGMRPALHSALASLEYLEFYELPQSVFSEDKLPRLECALLPELSASGMPERVEDVKAAIVLLEKLFFVIRQRAMDLTPQRARILIADRCIQLLSLAFRSQAEGEYYSNYYFAAKIIADMRNLSDMKSGLAALVQKIYLRDGSVERKTEDTRFLPILEYIDENLQEGISLAAVAAKFFFNPNYFSSYFKKNIGIGFNRYISILRIKKSLEMLGKTDKKVYEIANDCGYSDVKYFVRLFKQIYGYSPSEYRRGNPNGDTAYDAND